MARARLVRRGGPCAPSQGFAWRVAPEYGAPGGPDGHAILRELEARGADLDAVTEAVAVAIAGESSAELAPEIISES